MRTATREGASGASPPLLTWFVHWFTRQGGRALPGGFGRFADLAERPAVANRVRVNGHDLHCLEWRGGSGRPLVCLHGLNGTPWAWARVAAALHSHHVLAPSLRGHGDSDTPTADYTADTVARETLALLEGLGHDEVDLVGHSWGGKIAFAMAALAPNRVHRLVLADPVPPGGLNPLLRRVPELIDAAFAPERRVYPNRESFLAGMRELAYLATGDALDRRVWEDKYRETSDGRWLPRLPDSVYETIRDRGLAEDLRPLAPAVRAPAMLLRPTFSVAFFPGEVKALRRLLPGLRVRSVWGDHVFVHSNPRDTARALERFLR